MTEVLAIAGFVSKAVLQVLPAFTISIALGVLIRAMKLDGLIRHAFEARVGAAILLATAVGAFSPFCSCTVIPVVSGLLLAGVPLAPVMSFWVASPTMDPEMFALTVATLGWPLALARLGATLVLSLGAGYLTLALTRARLLPEDVLRPSVRRPAPAATAMRLLPVGALRPTPARPPDIAGGSGGCGCDGGTAKAASGPAGGLGAAPGWGSLIAASFRAVRWDRFGQEMVREGYRLGRWLLLAFVLEALMLRYVPQAAIAQVLGQGSGFAVVLAALVGVPLYLNNASALPIVSGLLAQGMQPGAAIAFLIAGPVTTVPAMSAVWGIARAPIFALYLGIALVGAIVLGFATNALLG